METNHRQNWPDRSVRLLEADIMAVQTLRPYALSAKRNRELVEIVVKQRTEPVENASWNSEAWPGMTRDQIVKLIDLYEGDREDFIHLEQGSVYVGKTGGFLSLEYLEAKEIKHAICADEAQARQFISDLKKWIA